MQLLSNLKDIVGGTRSTKRTRDQEGVGESGDHFRKMSGSLKEHGLGRPVVAIDLDAVDHNLSQLMRDLPKGKSLRFVEKSMPCVELVRYALHHTGGTRFMVFHCPWLPTWLEELPATTTFIMAKTFLPETIRGVFEPMSDELRKAVSTRVSWLVDSVETLRSTADALQTYGVHVNFCIEVEAGLRRGGVESEADLVAIVEAGMPYINAGRATLAGMMGYDGHAPFAPAPSVIKEWAVRRTVKSVTERYDRFIECLMGKFPELAPDGPDANRLVYNGAGSATFPVHQDLSSRMNDLSAGSAVLKPASFDLCTLRAYRAAIFIATPVIREQPVAELAFVGKLFGCGKGYYIYGGGWGDRAEYPLGIGAAASAGSNPRNLNPNQRFVCGPAPYDGWGVGDFVFYRPSDSDAMMQFEEIHCFRNGVLCDVWKSFPQRY